MDVKMPGMRGIEATRHLVRQLPGVKVIALTVLDDNPFPACLREAGAVGYLTKGCPAEEMIEAIRAVVGESSYVAVSIARKYVLAGWRGVSTTATPFEELSPGRWRSP